MTTASHDKDNDETSTPADGGGIAPAAQSHHTAGSDPRDTTHAVGEKQAAENADNEPAG